MRTLLVLAMILFASVAWGESRYIRVNCGTNDSALIKKDAVREVHLRESGMGWDLTINTGSDLSIVIQCSNGTAALKEFDRIATALDNIKAKHDRARRVRESKERLGK